MKVKTVFESSSNNQCIFDHVESAFGIAARNVVKVYPQFWGTMIHITGGDFAGWYDVHSDEDETNYYFISA